MSAPGLPTKSPLEARRVRQVRPAEPEGVLRQEGQGKTGQAILGRIDLLPAPEEGAATVKVDLVRVVLARRGL